MRSHLAATLPQLRHQLDLPIRLDSQKGTDMRKTLRPALLCVTAAFVLVAAPAASGSPAERPARIDHPERVAARVEFRRTGRGDHLTLPGGARVALDARVTYRDAAGATIAAGGLSSMKEFNYCMGISGWGTFCFRRYHAIEWHTNPYEWRGWARFDCSLNDSPVLCNFRHLDFAVYGAVKGRIAAKDFPDELKKSVAYFGGTFRSVFYDSSRWYRQASGKTTNPSYYARHIASGVRTPSLSGCSDWVDFITGNGIEFFCE
jgi:hypothetical protein